MIALEKVIVSTIPITMIDRCRDVPMATVPAMRVVIAAMVVSEKIVQ